METARVEGCENWKCKVGSKLKMQIEGERTTVRIIILAQCPLNVVLAANCDKEHFVTIEFDVDGKFSEGYVYEEFEDAFNKFKEMIW